MLPREVVCTYMVPEVWTEAGLFLQAGMVIETLNRLAGLANPSDAREVLEGLRDALREILNLAGIELHSKIDTGFEWVLELMSQKADEERITRELRQLHERAKDLCSEALPTLLFSPVSIGGHDPEVLLNDQASLLHYRTWKALSPMATRDVMCAGACLVFMLATASAFHILRATENLLNDYYEHYVPAEEQLERSHRTWGQMEPQLEMLALQGKVNIHTINRLVSLRVEHRNPTSHPEAEYTVDQAVSVYMDCRVTLDRMAAEMPERE